MNIRHGDMVLIGIEKLPEGLKASDSTVIMKGSGGNDHSFQKGVFYPHENGQVIGYLEAKNGRKIKGQTLRKVSLPIGFYSLHRQSEDTHAGMQPVQD